MNIYYILDKNHEVIPTDALTWGKFFEDFNNRRVAFDNIKGIHISTVFMGLDHSFPPSQFEEEDPIYQPLVFETMIFGGKHDDYQERYRTWNEAVEGHNLAVKLVKDDSENKNEGAFLRRMWTSIRRLHRNWRRKS